MAGQIQKNVSWASKKILECGWTVRTRQRGLAGLQDMVFYPAAGDGRHVAVLYGGKIFACRQCDGLAYPVQRENTVDRLARRADEAQITIRSRLGLFPLFTEYFIRSNAWQTARLPALSLTDGMPQNKDKDPTP